METVWKLRCGSGQTAANYWLSLAARDQTNYYAGSGEAPGVLIGEGLHALLNMPGVPGTSEMRAGSTVADDEAKLVAWLFSPEASEALFPPWRRAARTKADRERQGTATDDDGQVVGYDLTFSAPKGLSILAELDDTDWMRSAIHQAHDRAVSRAIERGEQWACWGREGKDGARIVEGGGLIGATFRHRTSRPAENGAVPDPHLHTHCLLANLVQHPDGTWGALDGRAIFSTKMVMGAAYRTYLLEELATEGVNLRWVVKDPRRGVVDLDMPDALIRGFSRRHEAVVEEALRRGVTSQAGIATVQRSGRQAKDREVAGASERELADLLRGELNRITVDGREANMADVQSCVTTDEQSHPLTDAELDAIALRLVAPLHPDPEDEEWGTPPNHLTAERATFGWSDATAAIAWAAMGSGTSQEAIEAAATRLLESSECVAYGEVDEMPLRTDTPPWRMRWTTREMLGLEARVLRMAAGGTGAGVGVVDEATVLRVLDAHPSLSREQFDAVRHLTTSGHQVDVVVGVAGSGKTFGLRAARMAWLESGHAVIGASISADAAAQLEAGSGIRSTTLTSLLMQLDAAWSEGEGLTRSDVVVVDEASMIDTRQLARLADHVARGGAKLVLVGDHRQLPAVGAGGIYAALIHERPELSVTLNENRRQREEWERTMLARLREGEGGVEEAMTAWSEHGRLHLHDDLSGAYLSIVQDWSKDVDSGKDALMLASTHRDVDGLNALARAWQVEQGQLDDSEGVTIPRKEGDDLRLTVGDRVVGLRNHKQVGIRNSDRGTIEAIEHSPRGATVTLQVRLDSGGVVDIPQSYVAGGHLALGYAITVHKSQGQTVDAVHGLASDSLTREAGYVLAGRGEIVKTCG